MAIIRLLSLLYEYWRLGGDSTHAEKSGSHCLSWAKKGNGGAKDDANYHVGDYGAAQVSEKKPSKISQTVNQPQPTNAQYVYYAQILI